VTVVATGYGEPRRRDPERSAPRTTALREPAGEPRVSRVREMSPRELDVPEFIPRR
jgi:hypothetical protein